MMSTPQAPKPFPYPVVLGHTPYGAAIATGKAPGPAQEPENLMTPQAWDIYKHLQEAGSISNVEAQAVYRCRALPRRIADIEVSMGIEIARTWKKDATGQRYVRYSLVD